MDRTLFRVTGLALVIVGTYALARFNPPPHADPGGVNMVRELCIFLILAGLTQLKIAGAK